MPPGLAGPTVCSTHPTDRFSAQHARVAGKRSDGSVASHDFQSGARATEENGRADASSRAISKAAHVRRRKTVGRTRRRTRFPKRRVCDRGKRSDGRVVARDFQSGTCAAEKNGRSDALSRSGLKRPRGRRDSTIGAPRGQARGRRIRTGAAWKRARHPAREEYGANGSAAIPKISRSARRNRLSRILICAGVPRSRYQP